MPCEVACGRLDCEGDDNPFTRCASVHELRIIGRNRLDLGLGREPDDGELMEHPLGINGADANHLIVQRDSGGEERAAEVLDYLETHGLTGTIPSANNLAYDPGPTSDFTLYDAAMAFAQENHGEVRRTFREGVEDIPGFVPGRHGCGRPKYKKGTWRK